MELIMGCRQEAATAGSDLQVFLVHRGGVTIPLSELALGHEI